MRAAWPDLLTRARPSEQGCASTITADPTALSVTNRDPDSKRWERTVNAAFTNRTARLRGFAATRSHNTLVFPRSRLRLEPGAALDVTGALRLGVTWPGGRFYDSHALVRSGGTFRVTGRVSIHTDFRMWINEGATLTLGSGYINAGFNLSCFCAVSIGEDFAVSECVTIRDGDNHKLSGARDERSPVVIGNHVWIGMNATILKGVTIGDGAVVAANAVVTRDVAPRALVAGVPARVLREDVDWD